MHYETRHQATVSIFGVLLIFFGKLWVFVAWRAEQHQALVTIHRQFLQVESVQLFLNGIYTKKMVLFF